METWVWQKWAVLTEISGNSFVAEDTADSSFMDEIKEQAQGGTESEGGLGVKSMASVNEEEEGTFL